ncbi:HEPACAM family member 2 isoform X1 [Alosa pseudoharengus]|uniref:HEPACAM family member 2 isoform X1 n=1 Tax=Alosa pseudoharengus TaxID=34774 RepID=UPI003F8AD8D6
MKSVGSPSFLLFCASVFVLSDTSSDSPRPRILHGTKGMPLTLPVMTRFPLHGVDIQGSWSKTKPDHSHLVSFENGGVIKKRLLRNRISLNLSDASLLIHRLDESSEGEYKLELNIELSEHNREQLMHKVETVYVTVDVPVSTPTIEKRAAYELIEDRDNVTWTCSVTSGTKVQYQWLKDNLPIRPDERHIFSPTNNTLVVQPVRKEDIGRYTCLVRNYISQRQSPSADLNIYYGPYNLAIKSHQGLKTGEVFMVDPSEVVLFDCFADSNPPNSCVWISKNGNRTEVVMTGLQLEVNPHELAQAKEFVVRAFNNVTQKEDEAQFLVVASPGSAGKQKLTHKETFLSPLAAITLCCPLIIIVCGLLLFKRTCHAKRVIITMKDTLSKRPITEQKRPHRSGHEDATEDFGIYEFVAIPGRLDSTQASCRSLAHPESTQDLHTTIYDVIRRIPETPTLSLLK